ncbi:hypothetical protein Bca4012_046222 [Brassica carinata]
MVRSGFKPRSRQGERREASGNLKLAYINVLPSPSSSSSHEQSRIQSEMDSTSSFGRDKDDAGNIQAPNTTQTRKESRELEYEEKRVPVAEEE